ncbi:MAG: hypothetical protein FWF24_04750 [Alphaproteobacteria bacterium]|nr:hypothetical protein [Alphaproteobacteria bacterium]
METLSNTHTTEKTPDTANTVQIFDCNSSYTVPNLNDQPESMMVPEMLTLIDILARQAAREICNPEKGGLI